MSELALTEESKVLRKLYDKHKIDPTKEIRILKLLPAANDEIITCELHPAALNSGVDYTALSYVWGNPTKTNSIQIDSHPFFVTDNLFNALRRIRAFNKDEVVSLWVDAVCIDQSQLEERSQQVSLMGEIYSSCKEVLIWMGEYLPLFDEDCCVFSGTEADFEDEKWSEYLACFNSSDDAERRLESITDCSCDKSDIDILRHCMWFFRLLAEGHEYNKIPPFSLTPDTTYPNQIDRGMSWLRGRPWFKRLWTVQEAVLAPQSTMLLGPVSMPYHVLFKAYANLGTQAIPGRLPGLSMSDIMAGVIWFLKFGEPMETLRQERVRGELSSLMQLCLQFNEHVSTEDLDRVYSLLGLVSDSGTVVNYMASPSSVYTQMSARYMVDSSSLLPLAFSAWRLKYPDIPSWAIDWSVESASHPSTRSSWSDALRLFDACGALPQSISMHENRLSLLGVEIDYVSEVGSIVPEMGDIFLPPPDWWEIVIRLSQQKEYPSGCSWLEAWWRILCVDCSWSSHGASRATMRHIESLATYTLHRYKRLVDFDKRLTPSASVDYKEYENDSVTQDVLTASVCFTRNRKLFVTNKGYLGLGHNNISTDDLVFILPGLRCPIILRSVDGTMGEKDQGPQEEVYSVVSEGFIHGLMDGEGVQGKDVVTKHIHIV